MNVADALKLGSTVLQDAEIADASRDANLLLQHVIGKERTFVIAHPEHQLSNQDEDFFRTIVARRAMREPLQYILGQQEFYGLDFVVTPAVLIPRPETEMIVERAIEILADQARPRILEIGVGSGCIIVSILKHCTTATAVAVDVSGDAIEVAARNTDVHGVASRIQMVRSDVFSNIPTGRFDLIASNPPYVVVEDIAGLQPEVREFEPHTALTDGGDGLTIIRQIVAESPKLLVPGGHLLIEFGFGQIDAVREMFGPGIWGSVEIEPDLQGIPRMVVAKLA